MNRDKIRRNIFYFYNYKISSEYNDKTFIVERYYSEFDDYEPIATFYIWADGTVDFHSIGTKFLEIPAKDASKLNSYIVRTINYLVKNLNIREEL